MEWVRVCNANSLSNGKLISFDNNNNKILIAKVQNKIYATDGIDRHDVLQISLTSSERVCSFVRVR